MKSPIKYAGGKGRIAKDIINLFPDSFDKTESNLIVPFMGGASVALAVEADGTFVNDSNLDLVKLFGDIRSNFNSLNIATKSLGIIYNELDTEERKSLYLAVRNVFNGEDISSPIDPDITKLLHLMPRSALFYFMNKTGFNGLCRYNKSREYNVPFGDGKDKNFNIDKRLPQVMHRWTFYSEDWKKLVLNLPDSLFGNCVIYLDPPYLNKGKFTSYTGLPFTEKDHSEIVDYMVIMGLGGIPVITSGASNQETYDTYSKSGFVIHEIDSTSSISRDGTGRGKIKELVICNYG